MAELGLEAFKVNLTQEPKSPDHQQRRVLADWILKIHGNYPEFFHLGATRISKMFASGALKPPELLFRSLPILNVWLFGEVYERRNHWTLLQKIRMDQQFRKLSCIDIIKDSFYSELDGIDLNKFATQFEDCEVLPSDQVWIVCMDASRTSNSDPRSPNDAERNIAIPKVEWNFRNSLPPDSIEIGSGRWWHMCKTGHLSGGTCRPLLSEEYKNIRYYVVWEDENDYELPKDPRGILHHILGAYSSRKQQGLLGATRQHLGRRQGDL